MEEPAPARATRSMTEIGEPPVNGMMETGENGPDEADANHTHEENRQIMLKRSSRVAKLKEQASLSKVDSDDDTNDKNTKLVTGLEDVPSGGDVEGVSVASSEINNDSIPERNNNSVIVPATIDVETLAIQSKSIPSFSPSTSAGSGADDESAGSSVDTSGTSTPVKGAQSSILYNILTSQLKKSVKKNVNLSQVITDLPKVALNELAVKKTFKCRHCSRLFLKEYDFKQHERCHMVAEEKPFQCPQCGKRFASNSKLTIHMRIHTGEQPYQCDSCGKRFMTRSMARKHSERCNRPGGMRSKYSIPNLLETPKKKKQAVETTKPRVKTAVSEPGTGKDKESSKSSDKTYRCMNCYTICRDKQSYAEHVKQHKEDAALEGLYTCKKCGKCYERLYNLKKHMKLHDGSAPHACKLCGFRCLRKYTLQMHMEWHRNGGPKRSSRYKCKICRDSFQQASKLILHMKGHKVKKETVSKEMQRAESGPIAEWPNVTDKMSYGSRFAASCPHCKKHFTRKFDLLRHIKTHLKNLHHTCKYCDSTFMIKPNFIKHMHLHTSQDYHVCRSCGLVYNKKVQRHRQEKLCWFKTRQALVGVKGRDTSDSGEESAEYWDVMKPDPITCEYCDLTFSSKSNLCTHMKRHGSGHTCHWCGMVYEMKKQRHDPKFNCFLKTRQGIMKKEKEKFEKTGNKPLAILEGKVNVDKPTVKGNQQLKKNLHVTVKDKKDLWRYECKYCDWAFVDGGNKSTHQRLHEDGGHHTCRWCGLVYQKKRQRHDKDSRCWLTTVDGRLQKAKADKKVLTSPPMIVKPAAADKHLLNHNFQCQMCHSRFDKESELNKHIDKEPHNFKCAHCERRFVTNVGLNMHLTLCVKQKHAKPASPSIPSGSKRFPCKVCGQSFDRSYTLAIHARYSHKDISEEGQKKRSLLVKEGRSCPYCHKKFTFPSQLFRHMKSHMANLTDKSALDYQNMAKLSNKSALASHLESHTSADDNKCTICGKEFVHRMNYLKHLQVHSQTTPYTCNKCGRGYILEDRLQTHKKLCHGDKAENEFSYSDQSSAEEFSSEPSTSVASGTTGVGSYVCQTCKRRFKQKGHLVWHQKSHPECASRTPTWTKKKSKCRFCLMSFANSARLMIHIRNVHQKKPSPPPTDLQAVDGHFQCPKCPRTFTKMWSMNRHTAKYHQVEIKPLPNVFHCQYCDETSTRLDFHVAHEKLHTENIYKIQCEVCKVGFKCNEDMEEHKMISHELGNPSNQDSESYPQQEQQKVVKVVRPYACRYCNLGFAKVDFLNRHERTHAEESRPYSCQHCTMKFRRFTGLTKHESIKHPDQEQSESDGGKPKAGPVVRADDYKETSPNFTCKGCNKEFIRLNAFEIHEKKCLEKYGKTPADIESDVTEPLGSPVELPQVGTSSESLSSESDVPIDLSTKKAAPVSENKMETDFRCNMCGQTFVYKQSLDLHMRFHTGSKPHQCTKCDEAFPRKDYLVRHEKKHEIESSVPTGEEKDDANTA